MRQSMSRTSRVVRLTVAFDALAIVTLAQFGRHDDWFPLGMLGQYAEPRDPNGTVLSTYLEAIDDDGRSHPIQVTAATTGLRRVELELLLPALQHDPTLLQPVADRLVIARPDLEFVALRVAQHRWRFEDGAVLAEPDDLTLIVWEVP